MVVGVSVRQTRRIRVDNKVWFGLAATMIRRLSTVLFVVCDYVLSRDMPSLPAAIIRLRIVWIHWVLLVSKFAATILRTCKDTL